MKKLLILLLTICSIQGFGQILVDPATSISTTRYNAAVQGKVNATGTDTYIVDYLNTGNASTGITTYTGLALTIQFANANTGTATLNINGIGAVTIKKQSSGSLANLSANDIGPNERKDIYYDGTFFVIKGGTGSGGAVGALLAANNLSDLSNTGTARTNLGLGTLATQSGTFSGTSSGTNTGDQDLSGLMVKSANLSDLTIVSTARTNLGLGTAALISSTAGGDLSGTLPSPTVAKINGNIVPANASGVLTNNGSGTLTWAAAGGSGTVTTVSVTTANGVSGSVANATTTPAISLTLGAITPTSIGSATTATTQSANDNSTKISTTAYADAKVADAINDATTTIAPSQNAVFDALALKALKFPTTNTQTTAYTAANTDAGNLIEYNSASPANITIPPTSTGTWTSDTYLNIVQKSTGAFTVTAGAGVTFINVSTSLVSSGAGSLIGLKYIGSDVWYVFNGVPSWNPAGSTTITANTTQTGAFKNTFSLNGLEITQNGQTGTPVNGLKITPGAHTSLTASTVMRNILVPDYTWSWATGNVVGQTFNYLGQPTIQATGASNFLLTSNLYVPNIVMGTNATGTATPSTTAGNFGIEAVGYRVSNPSFGGGGFWYQSAANTTIIGGGPAGENFQFGSGNLITASATLFGSKGFTGNTGFNSSNNCFRAQTNFTGSSGSTSPIYYTVAGASISINSTYTGRVTGFSYDPTMTNTGAGGQVGFESKSTLGAITNSNAAYTGFLVDPTINTAASGTASTVSGFDYNPTETDVTSVAQYGIRIFTANAKSGFATSTPNSTIHINGSMAMAYVAKTATYTATATDYTIDCTSGTFTVTLPTAVGCSGRLYVISNSGAGTITIGTTSSQTFANVTATPTTLTLATVGARTVQSNGANWLLISSL